MPALCDVSVLLALVTNRHALHGLAVRWADRVPVGGRQRSADVPLGEKACKPLPNAPTHARQRPRKAKPRGYSGLSWLPADEYNPGCEMIPSSVNP